MNKHWLSGLALAAGMAFANVACADIEIGVGAPVTGPGASGGAQLRQGVGQAAEDFNKSGGTLGKRSWSNRETTSAIPNRACRSPTSSSATACNSSSAT